MLHQHERRPIDIRCTGRYLERNTPSINIGDHDLPALAAPTTDLLLADPTKPVTLCGETLLQTGPIWVTGPKPAINRPRPGSGLFPRHRHCGSDIFDGLLASGRTSRIEVTRMGRAGPAVQKSSVCPTAGADVKAL